MAEKYRYSKYLKPIYPTGRRSKRTIIPQTPYRPVTVRRTSSKEEEYNPEYSWMTVHRLGPHRDTPDVNALEKRAIPSSQRKGTLPERIMLKALRDLLRLREGADYDFQCVGSHNLVLTRDLRWIPAGELKPGDELLAFTESKVEESGKITRRFTESTVLHNKVEMMESYRVRLSDGKEIITTAEHPWLTMRDPRNPRLNSGSTQVWRTTENLCVGTRIPVFLDVWEENASRDAGYIAGFFDGEGSLIHGKTQTGGHSITLTASQNAGSVMDEFLDMNRRCGFRFSIYDYRQKHKRSYDNKMRDVIHMRIAGGRPESLRFLGTIRPAKMSKLNPEKLGKLSKYKCNVVLSVEPCGTTPIARLSTSSETFFCEGMGMHNSMVEGGRTDKGGMVLDFVFPQYKMIIQVQGPTHDKFLQIRKDTEQRMIVAEWGYTVEYFTQEEIYNQVVFEEKLRRIFNLTNRRGCRGYNADAMISGDEYDRELYSRMFAMAQNIQAELLRV